MRIEGKRVVLQLGTTRVLDESTPSSGGLRFEGPSERHTGFRNSYDCTALAQGLRTGQELRMLVGGNDGGASVS